MLGLMLQSCRFVFSGLIVHVIACLFFVQTKAKVSSSSIITSGSLRVGLIISGVSLPLGSDANLFGPKLFLLTFLSVIYYEKNNSSKLTSI